MHIPADNPAGTAARALALAVLTLSAGPADRTLAAAAGALHNTFVTLERDRRLRVVVVGNSVSAGHRLPDGGRISYYHGALDWLDEHFPDAAIELETRILFAIGPETQLFWMDEDVTADPPDLLLVEFGAANGAWGPAGRIVTDPGTEGYIRRLRLLLPETDCLINIGLFKDRMADYRENRVPGSAAFLQQVGAHYGCAVADSAAALAQRILAGEAWDVFMKDGIHPAPAGYRVHQETIRGVLDAAYAAFRASDAPRRVLPHDLPGATLHPAPWWFPRRVPAVLADDAHGFAVARSGRLLVLKAQRPGAAGSFHAGRGAVVGLLTHQAERTAPPPSLELRLDDGAWFRLENGALFMHEGDRSNRYRRHFFARYGQAAAARRVHWRVPADATPGTLPSIAAFLVIEQTDVPCPLEP
ncbi:MAG: SGNH/GDSL hydrolase family protein [Lentisphaerae bacterium]|nr:SGNH/GDSL hydrolase family protein [Lentisphaerota bacterium]